MNCEIEVNSGEVVLPLVVDDKSFEVMTCSALVSVVVCTTSSVVVEFDIGVKDLLVKGNCEFVSFPSVVDGATNVEAKVEEDSISPSSPDDLNVILGSGGVD